MVAAAAVLIALLLLGLPNGDRTALPLGASIGDVLAVEEPEWGWVADNRGRRSRFRRWSGFAEGAIMNY